MAPGAPSAVQLGREVGVSHSALSQWLRDAQNRTRMKLTNDAVTVPTTPSTAVVATTTSTAPRKPRDPAEQLRLLIEAQGLSDEALGSFLRREGIHAAELETWRTTVLNALGERTPARSAKTSDRRRIAELERELARKEKALAEAAALLVLKKKFQEYVEGADKPIFTPSGR